ncbi:hypothetical protein VE04_01819 [Pseudogymnoascus sp. 24MN13]|nr:hypothetical protein VE04_01819 [Pseudogymnoascus sp. 24MN13]
MKDVLIKMKWKFSKKLEATMKLEAEIVAYLGAINLLLGFYVVKVNTLAEQRARCRSKSLTKALANLHFQTEMVSNNVAQVQYQVEQGTCLVRKDIEVSSKETSQALKSLQQSCFASVSGFLKTAETLSKVILQTGSKVSEIYTAVLWLQTHHSEPDTRYTWLQEPMRWEDAYGRVIPIPVEFDYPMMEGALRGHFQKGRGKKLVERNQWQLFDPSNPRTIYSAENWEPCPGMKITMAMIISQSNDQIVCPRPICSSKSYTDATGSGKICSECQTWFDSLPKSSSPEKLAEIVNSKQFSRGSSEIHIAKIPPKITRAAKDGQQARDEDTRSDSDFQIDEEDLRLLKNALIQLEGPKRTSMQYIPARLHYISSHQWDSRLIGIQDLLLDSSKSNYIRHIYANISEPGFMPR